MPEIPRPQNLGITRRLAVLVGFVAVLISVTCLAWAVAIYGVDERTAPVVLPLFGVMGLAISQLVGTLKSAEAADTAAKSAHAAYLTESKTSAVMQALTSHCGEMCPLEHCGLRDVNVRPSGGLIQ